METSAPLDMQALRSQCYPKRQTRVTSLGAYMSGRSETNPASTPFSFHIYEGRGSIARERLLDLCFKHFQITYAAIAALNFEAIHW